MIEARALVVGVSKGVARVRVLDRQEGCGRCDEPGGCRSVKLAYSLRPPKSEFELPDTLGVEVGEEVALHMQDGSPLRGAMASYGLALLLLLAGAGLGQALAPAGREDLFALLGCALGLVLAFAASRMLHRSRRWRRTLAMEMSRPPVSGVYELTDS